MSRLNLKAHAVPIFTHEGAKAFHINPEKQLRRLVLACMLWEDQFYVDGKSTAELIRETVPHVNPETVAQIAIEAREKQKLRHVPLLLVRELARVRHTNKNKVRSDLVSETLARVIQRPDELTEFLAIYWADNGKKTLSAQVKKGLAAAFNKFNAYSLAKYNRDGKVKLRDVAFLTHVNPGGPVYAETIAKLVNKSFFPKKYEFGEFYPLVAPDTWEVNLSGGTEKKTTEQKKEVWREMLTENKLGAMALLRNLRNMQEAGVPIAEIKQALTMVNTERVLPFRFISAARYAPTLEPELEQAMFKSLAEAPKLKGHTVLLVDVSGSMGSKVSGKSEIMRMDAACGVAMLLREVAEQVTIYSFSENSRLIPNRHGFALRDAIVTSQGHGGTMTGKAVDRAKIETANGDVARMIIITDEQSHQSISGPMGLGYVINVASYQNGIGYGPWNHIDGWSEAVIDFIRESEESPE